MRPELTDTLRVLAAIANVENGDSAVKERANQAIKQILDIVPDQVKVEKAHLAQIAEQFSKIKIV